MRKIYYKMNDGQEIVHSELTGFKDVNKPDETLNKLAKAAMTIDPRIVSFEIREEN